MSADGKGQLGLRRRGGPAAAGREDGAGRGADRRDAPAGVLAAASARAGAGGPGLRDRPGGGGDRRHRVVGAPARGPRADRLGTHGVADPGRDGRAAAAPNRPGPRRGPPPGVGAAPGAPRRVPVDHGRRATAGRLDRAGLRRHPGGLCLREGGRGGHLQEGRVRPVPPAGVLRQHRRDARPGAAAGGRRRQRHRGQHQHLPAGRRAGPRPAPPQDLVPDRRRRLLPAGC